MYRIIAGLIASIMIIGSTGLAYATPAPSTNTYQIARTTCGNLTHKVNFGGDEATAIKHFGKLVKRGAYQHNLYKSVRLLKNWHRVVKIKYNCPHAIGSPIHTGINNTKKYNIVVLRCNRSQSRYFRQLKPNAVELYKRKVARFRAHDTTIAVLLFHHGHLLRHHDRKACPIHS